MQKKTKSDKGTQLYEFTHDKKRLQETSNSKSAWNLIDNHHIPDPLKFNTVS